MSNCYLIWSFGFEFQLYDSFLLKEYLVALERLIFTEYPADQSAFVITSLWIGALINVLIHYVILQKILTFKLDKKRILFRHVIPTQKLRSKINLRLNSIRVSFNASLYFWYGFHKSLSCVKQSHLKEQIWLSLFKKVSKRSILN